MKILMVLTTQIAANTACFSLPCVHNYKVHVIGQNSIPTTADLCNTPQDQSHSLSHPSSRTAGIKESAKGVGWKITSISLEMSPWKHLSVQNQVIIQLWLELILNNWTNFNKDSKVAAVLATCISKTFDLQLLSDLALQSSRLQQSKLRKEIWWHD